MQLVQFLFTFHAKVDTLLQHLLNCQLETLTATQFKTNKSQTRLEAVNHLFADHNPTTNLSSFTSIHC